jgi:hypothetical protein
MGQLSADNGVRADLSHLFLKMPMTRKRFGNSLPLRYLLKHHAALIGI